MIPFQIDLQDTVNEFSLQKADVDSLCDYMLDRMVGEFVSQWMKLVDSNLSEARDEYKKGIYTERPDTRSAIIGLTGRNSKLAMMIETGCSAFDEKLGFEKSDKKKFDKKGQWYLTIPFRVASSEAIMDMMVPDSDVSVIDLMKSGETMTQSTLPVPFQEIQTHSLQLNTGTIITYKHKAPIYEGMARRNINSTVNEKRGGYFTFRRVSEKSEDEAWMHPGFEPRLFMDKSLQLMQAGQAVDNAVQDWLDAKLG